MKIFPKDLVLIFFDVVGAGIDTPTMERLRPKPIDVNNITVTPQRLPDTQPSPGRAEAHSGREEVERVEGENLMLPAVAGM